MKFTRKVWQVRPSGGPSRFSVGIALSLFIGAALLMACTREGRDYSPQSNPATATIPDTAENRRQAAVRYHKVLPMQDLLNDMTEQVFITLPKESRERIRQSFFQKLDIAALETASVEIMVDLFSLGEIDALLSFYGSNEGKSVMKKMPTYMSALMPVIQKELAKQMPIFKQPSPSPS